MLGKLIKYDFKAIGKQMFPVYGVMLVLSLLLSLMIKLNFGENGIFGTMMFLYAISLLASSFGTVYCVVKRFRDSLLKDEGYLYFALPVKTSTHIIDKVLIALIWGFMTGLAMLLSSLIYVLILGSIRSLSFEFQQLLRMLGMVDKDIIISLLRALLLSSIETIAMILFIYSIFAVGHLFGKHQTIASVVFAIIVMVIRINSLTADSYILLYIFPLAGCIIYSFITWYILDRKLNLE